MKHFHEEIPGWFDFEAVYAAHVAAAQDGARFVEVGTLFGKSAACMGVEIHNAHKAIWFDTIDTFAGLRRDLIDAADLHWYDRTVAERGGVKEAAEYFLRPVAGEVHIRVGSSLAMSATYADSSLDFVFLDDDHSGPHVAAELRAWWPKVKVGGTLAGHDINFPEVEQAVMGFVDWLTRLGQRLMVQRAGSVWGIKKDDQKPRQVQGAPYPCVRYHAEHGERLVNTAEDEKRLGPGWSNKPGGVVEPGPAPEASLASEPAEALDLEPSDQPEVATGRRGGRGGKK
ncbi:class I SAM-dependent methyltransferase [bacterium]|nr:class I SAM-dependent methyltransferase [bacterium]